MGNLSEEDRTAFRNQARRVFEEVDVPHDFRVMDTDNAVVLPFVRGQKMAVLRVLPHHRFKVENVNDCSSEVTYDRPEAVEFVKEVLSS